jgi:hypothetical protein
MTSSRPRPVLVPEAGQAPSKRPRPSSLPLQGDEDEKGEPTSSRSSSPEQLELFDPYDDGLDFGAWMKSLPRTPGGSR